jgi:hypothetical protein
MRVGGGVVSDRGVGSLVYCELAGVVGFLGSGVYWWGERCMENITYLCIAVRFWLAGGEACSLSQGCCQTGFSSWGLLQGRFSDQLY